MTKKESKTRRKMPSFLRRPFRAIMKAMCIRGARDEAEEDIVSVGSNSDGDSITVGKSSAIPLQLARQIVQDVFKVVHERVLRQRAARIVSSVYQVAKKRTHPLDTNLHLHLAISKDAVETEAESPRRSISDGQVSFPPVIASLHTYRLAALHRLKKAAEDQLFAKQMVALSPKSAKALAVTLCRQTWRTTTPYVYQCQPAVMPLPKPCKTWMLMLSRYMDIPTTTHLSGHFTAPHLKVSFQFANLQAAVIVTRVLQTRTGHIRHMRAAHIIFSIQATAHHVVPTTPTGGLLRVLAGNISRVKVCTVFIPDVEQSRQTSWQLYLSPLDPCHRSLTTVTITKSMVKQGKPSRPRWPILFQPLTVSPDCSDRVVSNYLIDPDLSQVPSAYQRYNNCINRLKVLHDVIINDLPTGASHHSAVNLSASMTRADAVADGGWSHGLTNSPVVTNDVILDLDITISDLNTSVDLSPSMVQANNAANGGWRLTVTNQIFSNGPGAIKDAILVPDIAAIDLQTSVDLTPSLAQANGAANGGWRHTVSNQSCRRGPGDINDVILDPDVFSRGSQSSASHRNDVILNLDVFTSGLHTSVDLSPSMAKAGGAADEGLSEDLTNHNFSNGSGIIHGVITNGGVQTSVDLSPSTSNASYASVDCRWSQDLTNQSFSLGSKVVNDVILYPAVITSDLQTSVSLSLTMTQPDDAPPEPPHADIIDGVDQEIDKCSRIYVAASLQIDPCHIDVIEADPPFLTTADGDSDISIIDEVVDEDGSPSCALIVDPENDDPPYEVIVIGDQVIEEDDIFFDDDDDNRQLLGQGDTTSNSLVLRNRRKERIWLERVRRALVLPRPFPHTFVVTSWSENKSNGLESRLRTVDSSIHTLGFSHDQTFSRCDATRLTEDRYNPCVGHLVRHSEEIHPVHAEKGLPDVAQLGHERLAHNHGRNQLWQEYECEITPSLWPPFLKMESKPKGAPFRIDRKGRRHYVHVEDPPSAPSTHSASSAPTAPSAPSANRKEDVSLVRSMGLEVDYGGWTYGVEIENLGVPVAVQENSAWGFMKTFGGLLLKYANASRLDFKRKLETLS